MYKIKKRGYADKIIPNRKKKHYEENGWEVIEKIEDKEEVEEE